MKFRTGLLGILVAIWAVFAGGGLTGQAADSTTDQDAADLAAAQQSMPQGLPLSDYFKIGDFDGVNSAKVQDSTNPSTMGTQAVQLTNGTHQLGTIWANSAIAFDLSRDERASMWMYFGNKQGNAGDGMAFVLQNDPRGTKATALTKDGQPASGESLGVWGYPDDYTTEIGGATKVASQAIQDSWALEFDTFVNNQYMDNNTTKATSFDNSLRYPHVASGLPGNLNTYARKAVNVDLQNSIYNYATVMNHSGLIQGTDSKFLSNGAWHHLSLKWTASTDTMTYTLNDKDPATGDAQTGQSASVTIQPSQIGNKTTALWGFTGSTGDNSENNLVTFEQIPGLVNSSATGTVHDLTQNKVVAAGDSVNTNDRLRLDYQLNYDSGSAPWRNIRANLKLPTGVTPTSGQITNPDGTTSNFDVSDLTNQTLTTTLPQSLTTSQPKATVSVYAKASGTATTVPSSRGDFVGSNAITSATMNGFSVKQLSSSLSLLLGTSSTVNVDANQDADITGVASVLGGSVASKGVTLHPTLNGQDLATTTVSPGSFSYTVPAASLKPGTNTLNLYASDTLGDVSNDLNITIVVGSLDFGKVSATSTFKPTALIGTTQDILPADDWQLNVDDTRTAGNHWQLQASTTPFTDDAGHQLAGQLRYRTANDDLVLGSTPTTIATHTTDATSGSTTDVASGWNASTGLYLQVDGGAVAGTYTGKVTWTLSNAPS
ncbi:MULTISPECIES: hypothetical protein [Lactobacillaceae]|uniref:lectin-like domain-containing protein n=1 Tax=Lactobacillaceae TaxID=33958 RepID=UPI0014569669|nr:hypothetical protein [Lactobacillus sp. HBUAS51381]NLR08918.1 hypothetical protein [Lactobacillus sp. HBUAS51381]